MTARARQNKIDDINGDTEIVISRPTSTHSSRRMRTRSQHPRPSDPLAREGQKALEARKEKRKESTRGSGFGRTPNDQISRADADKIVVVLKRRPQPAETEDEKKEKGATAEEGSPVTFGVSRATEGQYKALDNNLQVQMFSFKPGQAPLCLEVERLSQNPPETEPQGLKKSPGRKPKRGEAGRKAALEARLRRKASGQLAVKNTNKTQKPKRHRRKPNFPRRAAF